MIWKTDYGPIYWSGDLDNSSIPRRMCLWHYAAGTGKQFPSICLASRPHRNEEAWQGVPIGLQNKKRHALPVLCIWLSLPVRHRYGYAQTT